MLGILGLGLRGYQSLTVDEIVFLESADRIFLDTYTSVMYPEITEILEKKTGKKIESVNREILENNEFLFDTAVESKVALLVSGDPFTATTHNEIRYQCSLRNIDVKIFENASILNSAIGYSGISHYKTAPPVSVPRISDNFFPISVYRKIEKNIRERKHTILLLDTADGNPMKVNEALEILLRMEEKDGSGIILQNTRLIVISALGSENSSLLYGTIREVMARSVVTVPSTIILLSELDENEENYVKAFCTHA